MDMPLEQVAPLLSALLLALSPAPVHERRASPDPTVNRLENAYSFAFGGVGFVSAISPDESDYRTILLRKSAAEDFERVFKFGNVQAKCYALTGLRQVDPMRFESLAAPLQSSMTCVPVTRGCQTFNHAVGEIVKRIRAGVYSGQLRRELVPPSEPEKPRIPDREPTTWKRMLSLLSFAFSKPDPPPPPLALPPPPPPPPPAFRHRDACNN